MKELVYSLRELASEQNAQTLEASLSETLGSNEALRGFASDLKVSWLGEFVSVKVGNVDDLEKRTILEELIRKECEKLGCVFITPPVADNYVLDEGDKTDKKRKCVSFSSALISIITAVIITMLLTFSITTAFIHTDAPSADKGGEDIFAPLDLVDRLFRSASVSEEIDDEAIIDSVLKAYAIATGDRYAAYFNEEEFAALQESQDGNMCGIGISVVSESITVQGYEYITITVTYVNPDSPAERAGIKQNDRIYVIGTEEDGKLVTDIGYSAAMDMLLGEEGTYAEFIVLRESDGADPDMPYDVIPFSVKREQIKTQSVTYDVCDTDSSVGIVRINNFDNTTPSQLEAAMDALIEEGCEYYVIDLRNNTGGLLTSVEDALTFFLKKGDVMISIEDSVGNKSSSAVMGAGVNGKLQSGSGELEEADIGKYRDLKLIVLTNEYTASAAELFAANMRDYKLASLVGTKTYGKGSMQSTVPLSHYGYKGAFKLTTARYFPPSGEGYDGIGITPDVVVEMSEEAANMNFYNLVNNHQDLDNQLQRAIEEIKN